MKIEFDPTAINEEQATCLMNIIITKFGCSALEFKDGEEDCVRHEVEDAFLNGGRIILSLAQEKEPK